MIYPTQLNVFGSGLSPQVSYKYDRASSSWKKHFNIYDHLGTLAQTYKKVGIFGITPTSMQTHNPFGSERWANSNLTETESTLLNWVGKEKDNESKLGDHGVRKYEYETGRFISIDPLWRNYYGWTPYQYSINSPVMMVDQNGLEVEALDASAERFIRLSVEAKYEKFVEFKDGLLDWRKLEANLPSGIDPNSNVATLVRLGQNPEIVTVSGKTGEFKYKNSKGEIITKNIYDYDKNEPYDTEKDVFVAGRTVLPYGDAAVIKNEFSLSGNTEIYINPTFNGGNIRTLSKTAAHELFLHFRFHILDIRHHHEEERINDPEYMKYWYNRYERQSIE